MKIAQMALLSSYSLGMAGGQLLLKQASATLPNLHGLPLTSAVWGIATNPWLIAGLALYGLLTAAWIWILSFIPLSLAYPFLALAIGITPLFAHFVFAEVLVGRQLLGRVDEFERGGNLGISQLNQA